ncbi:hypothetical protein [Pseudonocardia sp. KRD291]|uniref:hypothetical protein n=1 Tax=Pseudonocardia sp. KRD291 TaxID=2792007 RepID=UPI001C4A7072|nr:hypothetical protein [Pseudonocardia sp. KRD291]MBW0105816.1 hypothetical protein [Pseudonocardia sp. KRD291]
MRLYAERPERLGRQVVADVLAAAWTVLAVVVGVTVHDGLLALQAPGRTLADAGGRIGETFAGAAGAARTIPFVGEDLARAFDPATGTGADLVRAGQEYGDTIATVALWSGVLVTLGALLPVLLGWLPLRLRYARRAGAAVVARETCPDLLALRALGRVPVRRLVQVAPDPATAWRRGDPAVIHRLAALELSDLGLRTPAEPPR